MDIDKTINTLIDIDSNVLTISKYLYVSIIDRM